MTEAIDPATETTQKDFTALVDWLDRMILYLEQKSPNSSTHLMQALALRELFLRARAEALVVNLDLIQTTYLIHYMLLNLWMLQLSVCATLASSIDTCSTHSIIFVDFSNQLFEHFILLRDSLYVLVISRFEFFEEKYANLKVYSNIKTIIAIYRSYCLRFDDKICKAKIVDQEKGWGKIQHFLRVLGNKSGHEYDKHSKQTINLKDFDGLLEIDFEDDLEHHSKIGNKVHKYPLAILVLFRFLLKDQDVERNEINEKWFSCEGKFFDQSGDVKKIGEKI
ncbi:MAG TPA: hypothetical protein VIJ14_10100 [Rhabdochlamydiaceae bacterium]